MTDYTFPITTACVIGAGIFSLWLAHCVANHILFSVLWRGFGFRPEMFNEEVITATVKEAAEAATVIDSANAKAKGHPLTFPEWQQLTIHYERIFRPAIDRYVGNFHTAIMTGEIRARRVKPAAPASPADGEDGTQ